MQSQVYILIGAAAIMFAVIGGLSLLAHYYTLNGIKSRTVGDGQHGTARFASKQEVKNTYKHIPFQPELWRRGESLPTEQGVILGSKGEKNAVTALVDTDDVHILMIGASGVGKTAFFLYPNMEYACASGMSFLALDTKGDLARNYGSIAQNYYGYNVSVIDLRNPSRSNGNNLLTLINRYMDICRREPNNLAARAKAEKYAKILAKTIVNPEGDASSYGQNAFFYDAAEGLLTSVVLLLAEYLPPTDENPQEQRHIISVFKLVQDLLEPSKVKGKSQFQLLMNKLPGDHKARWFAGAALNSAEQAMASVMSTVLSRLNAFLDSELEQVLCFDSTIDAETFANEKSAIFLILPEEDQTKNFMAGLMIQNLSRELFSVADENGGKLKNRVVLFCDELGTMPPFDILPLFSAGRSRRLTLVPIIQSLAQLEKNYGREGSEIVQDNCQDTIFGGFAPNSQTAEVLSKALGSRTVMSGSVSRGKNDPSQSLQMMERPLMTADELKSIPKGSFVVMKTGTHPMRTKLRLFLDWGIRFGEPYTVEEKANRKVVYADKQALEENIVRRHTACMMVDEETGEILEPPVGSGTLHTPASEPSENTMRRRSTLKT
ncbi:type IV secretory system conjugative DNA transfer family protein [Hydrogenoanaerobacterium sp.]|uniref:type IV secretory system conjugative DNA transfer family protein n=1 Tax=Hydrogenoanaerobacterium sp. TaxID=2953763 RepID=UPI0028A030D6|nr:type IV secretory system conjugative DNA transfer family protein [Hydrogenoanaerobacterium sp.]